MVACGSPGPRTRHLARKVWCRKIALETSSLGGGPFPWPLLREMPAHPPGSCGSPALASLERYLPHSPGEAPSSQALVAPNPSVQP